MEVQTKNIKDLKLDPKNVRKHTPKNLKSIESSLQRFGQQKPILVDSSGTVRAGNGTLQAAKNLKWKSVDVIETDLSGDELKAYAIADNRTSELAAWDDEMLAGQLKELFDLEEDLLNSAGFERMELDAMLGDSNDLDEMWEGMPEFKHEDLEPEYTIRVHFATETDRQEFSDLIDQKITSNTRTIWFPPQETLSMANQGYKDNEIAE